jgi:hypothetical protein
MERTGNRKDIMRGFFAALRMTTSKKNAFRDHEDGENKQQQIQGSFTTFRMTASDGAGLG